MDFATRERDATGKFLSHISYVDFDPTFSKVVGLADHTVFPLGPTGTFDEHGVFPMHPFANGDELWGYTTGWSRRVSVSVDTSIGLVISRDGGETFAKVGTGPIMTASLHEPFLIADPFVMKVGAEYHMWYIFGTRWQPPATPDDQAERCRQDCARSIERRHQLGRGTAARSSRTGSTPTSAKRSRRCCNSTAATTWCSATGA